MSEILRAVLDDTCVSSMPVFYSVTLQSTTASAALQSLRSALQMKQDTWFLMTGLAAFYGVALAGGDGLTGQAGETGATLTITDLGTNKKLFSQDALATNLLNYNLNSFMTLPEYVLWEPAQVIGFDLAGFGLAAGTQYTYYVVLVGIEYRK